MKYGVYFLNENKEWVLIIKGLSYDGALNHVFMYNKLFNTKMMIAEDGTL